MKSSELEFGVPATTECLVHCQYFESKFLNLFSAKISSSFIPAEKQPSEGPARIASFCRITAAS